MVTLQDYILFDVEHFEEIKVVICESREEENV